jgi:hypothetical protein
MAAVFPRSLPFVSVFENFRPAGQRAGTSPPGHVAQRARTGDAWATARIGWVFRTDAQRAAFEAWFAQNLSRGHAWALIKLPITPNSGDPLAPCYSAVRFPNGYETPFRYRGLWRCMADVVIRDRFECALPINGPMVWVPSHGAWAMSDDDKAAAIGGFSNSYPHTYYNLQGSRFQSGGKVYWEVDLDDSSSSANSVGWCGLVTPGGYRVAIVYAGALMEQASGPAPDIYALPNTSNPFLGATSWAAPRTLRWAVDCDAGELWIGYESSWGIWTGAVAPNPATGAEPLPLLNPLTEPIRPELYHLPHHPTFDCRLRSTASEMLYPIPSGFLALGGNA